MTHVRRKVVHKSTFFLHHVFCFQDRLLTVDERDRSVTLTDEEAFLLRKHAECDCNGVVKFDQLLKSQVRGVVVVSYVDATALDDQAESLGIPLQNLDSFPDHLRQRRLIGQVALQLECHVVRRKESYSSMCVPLN